MGRMTADIPDAIDDTLSDWGDAMHWSPSPFRPLPANQVATVRQVAHESGLDGYAAWLAVADVQIHGTASPYAEWVWPEDSGPLGRQRPDLGTEAVQRMSAVAERMASQIGREVAQAARAIERFAAAMRPVAEAYMSTMGKMVRWLAPVAHAMDAGRNPRKHIRCHECRPYSNPRPLCIDGTGYHRRQRGRKRR